MRLALNLTTRSRQGLPAAERVSNRESAVLLHARCNGMDDIFFEPCELVCGLRSLSASQCASRSSSQLVTDSWPARTLPILSVASAYWQTNVFGNRVSERAGWHREQRQSCAWVHKSPRDEACSRVVVCSKPITLKLAAAIHSHDHGRGELAQWPVWGFASFNRLSSRIGPLFTFSPRRIPNTI
jgi:hypothetical protein